MLNRDKIVQRFISYVTVDTQSDPNSETTPSTQKQWDLAHALVKELIAIGLKDVTIDNNAYIMATLPSNVDHEVPTIGFISHFDTSPDFSGTHVKPQLVENYDGKDIILNEAEDIVLSPDYFEDLLLYKGQTLITTDGTTLLGADDKAGICEIVSAMEYLIQHPEIKHGTIKVGFTPDEEIGRGAHKFDVEKFGADWAYTMDGSQVGELEYENFNAAGAKVTVKGKSVHPGYAKGKLVNSMYIATDFINSLPRLETPEHTEEYQGFFHLHHVDGDVEQTTLQYIIRDHDRAHFEARKEVMQKLTNDINAEYGREVISIEIKDQYFNMREKVEPVMHIVDIAEEAMKQLD
ncbi:MAG: peptidase T, partial [Mangrovimonas sp.]|nr:peptidase T [Mangrovimonas sp.]